MTRVQVAQLSFALMVLLAAPIAAGQTSNDALLTAAGGVVPVHVEQAAPIADEDRAIPVGTAFTYQGLLGDGGSPANGQYDMQFTLTDELGVPVAGSICVDNVVCVEGLFTTTLDFGAWFPGETRELLIAVRPGGAASNCAVGGGYTVLAPRQRLTPVPYALGLSLPYKGAASVDGSGGVFEVANNFPALFRDWAIRASCGGYANYSTFADSAAIRGDGVGYPVAGVIGVSDNYAGVIGYNATGGYGVVGRSDGGGGIGVKGTGPGVLSGWAGYFDGRGYFAGDVGIGTSAPSADLDVVGKTKTEQLQVTTGAAAGRVLTSDGAGNATWQAAPAPSTTTGFVSGYGANPTSTLAFLAPVTTVAITAEQKILVTAHKAFGSTVAGGADGLNLWIGYRQTGSGNAPSTVGAGILGNRVPQYTRFTFGLSAVITGLPAGTYDVGMVGTAANGANWNSNEYGYVTAIVLN